MMRSPIRRRQFGASLIEVLVTMLIMSIALLGLMGLQARSISLQTDSAVRRTASIMSGQLRELFSANQQWYSDAISTLRPIQFTRDQTVAVPNCRTVNACTSDETFRRDLNRWVIELRQRLPGAIVVIEPAAQDPTRPLGVTVRIGWREPDAPPSNTNACSKMGALTGGDAAYRCLVMSTYPG